MLNLEEEHPDETDARSAEPQHLLWCLLFLKTYDKESNLAAKCDLDEKTYRKWVWYFTDKISWLEAEVVSLSPDFAVDC